MRQADCPTAPSGSCHVRRGDADSNPSAGRSMPSMSRECADVNLLSLGAVTGTVLRTCTARVVVPDVVEGNPRHMNHAAVNRMRAVWVDVHGVIVPRHMLPGSQPTTSTCACACH